MPPSDIPAVDPATGMLTADYYDLFKQIDTLDPLSSIDNSALIASIALKSNILRSINPQAGTTYTFALADNANYVRFTSASAVTATIPPNATIAFPVGSQIDVIQAGAGKLTIAAGAGVTINSFSSNKSAAGRYAGLTLIQTDTLDTWDLVGSLIP